MMTTQEAYQLSMAVARMLSTCPQAGKFLQLARARFVILNG